MRSVRKCRLDLGFFVPHECVKAHVAGCAIPYAACILGQRRVDGRFRRQFVVVDHDQFSCVLRGIHRLRDDDRDGFAHVTHLVRRDHRLAIVEYEPAAVCKCLGFGVAAVGRIGDVKDIAMSVRIPVLPGEDRDDTGQLQCIGGVDPINRGMGVGRADKLRVALPCHVDIVAESPLAGQQARVFPSGKPPTDHPRA